MCVFELTLQATSTFMELVPKRVGGALFPAGMGLIADLEGEELSQRCRNRVTSSCSSMVFICLEKTNCITWFVTIATKMRQKRCT